MYYAIDYGHGKIALAWGQENTDHSVFKHMVELVRSLASGSIVIAERSLANFDRIDYNNALRLAKEKGIELRAVSTHAVKGYRKSIGKPKEKNAPFDRDIEDAKILLLLFGEGSIRSFGKFKEYVTPNLPEILKDRLNLLVVDARRYDKWKPQISWLKKNKMEEAKVLCSARVIAQEIKRLHGSRRLYRSFARISEYGRALPIHRSNGTYWLYRATKNHSWGSFADRKARAKEINKLIDKIWTLTVTEKDEPVLPF
jgi:hypothetical protein